jgi:hypothetical protein
MTEIVRVGAVEFLAGQYMVREVRSSRPPAQENSFLLINGLAAGRSGPTQWRVGAYHYYYSRPEAIAAALADGELNSEFRTNRVLAAGYFSGYSTLATAAMIARARWRAAAEIAVNLGANRDPTLGPAFRDREQVAVGGLLRYGNLGRPWGWSVETGFFHIEADAVIAVFNSDDLQQTNVNSIPLWLRLTLPGGAGLVWDTYIQRKIDVALPSNGGVVHGENATKVRSRLSVQVDF